MEADKIAPLEVFPDDEVVARMSLGIEVGLDLRITYEELDHLAILYAKVKDYEKVVVTIKEGIRRLKGQSVTLLIARDQLQPNMEHMSSYDQAVRGF